LLTHPDLRHLARIAAVLTWIEATMRKAEHASLSQRGSNLSQSPD
jgi:hypothetical protein